MQAGGETSSIHPWLCQTMPSSLRIGLQKRWTNAGTSWILHTQHILFQTRCFGRGLVSGRLAILVHLYVTAKAPDSSQAQPSVAAPAPVMQATHRFERMLGNLRSKNVLVKDELDTIFAVQLSEGATVARKLHAYLKVEDAPATFYHGVCCGAQSRRGMVSVQLFNGNKTTTEPSRRNQVQGCLPANEAKFTAHFHATNLHSHGPQSDSMQPLQCSTKWGR